MWKHYVYTHHRADTGEIFYVGKGAIHSRNPYRRAHARKSRNRWWTNIVAKHGLSVEIVAHCIDDAAAQETERQLIARYGRADVGAGPLVNLTDGGDGTAGIIISADTRKKRSEAASRPRSDAWVQSIRKARRGGGNGGVVKHGDKLPPEWRESLARAKIGERNPMFGKTGAAHPNRRGVVNQETGETWPTVTAAANALGVRMQTLHNQLSGRRPNRTPLRIVG